VIAYLQSDTGSSDEKHKQRAMQAHGVEIAPHVGEALERKALFSGQQRNLSPQARAQGFG